MVDLNDQRAPELTDYSIGKYQLRGGGSPPHVPDGGGDMPPGVQAILLVGALIAGAGVAGIAMEMMDPDLAVGLMIAGPVVSVIGIGFYRPASQRRRSPKAAAAPPPPPRPPPRPSGPSAEETERQRREARARRLAQRAAKAQRKLPPEAMEVLHDRVGVARTPGAVRAMRPRLVWPESIRAMRQAAGALQAKEAVTLRDPEEAAAKGRKTFDQGAEGDPGDAVPAVATPVAAGPEALPPAILKDPGYQRLAQEERRLEAEAVRAKAKVETLRAAAQRDPGGPAAVQLVHAKQAHTDATNALAGKAFEKQERVRLLRYQMEEAPTTDAPAVEAKP